MERTTSEIATLHEECLRLCRDLKSCLDDEWSCLVEYRPDGLLATNQRKENLVAALTAKRSELRRAQSEGPALPESARAEWLSAWDSTRERCEENQRFMRHSLRNMEALLDNIKRLMGRSSLYSAKGKRVDLAPEGKVVTARY